MVGEPPFLRIPPFPRHRAAAFDASNAAARAVDPLVLIAALRDARVGGTFWGPRPTLSAERDILLAPDTPAQARAMAKLVRAEGVTARVVMIGHGYLGSDMSHIEAGCDPWHLADQACEIRAGAAHEMALVGAIAGRRLRVSGGGAWAGADGADAALPDVVARLVGNRAYRDPFTGAAIDALAAIALLAQWRALIDANRPLTSIHGVARWKRVTMDALLWGGDARPAYDAQPLRLGQTLVWRSRVSPRVLATMAARRIEPGEIEDGMIRSSGLGANCVPPLSVIVDPVGVYFDPARPSAIETLLVRADFDEATIARAAALRQRLVTEGIGKYGRDSGSIPRRDAGRRMVLVIGQVEDDRAVLLGGAGMTNRALLAAARTCEPDAALIYRPHPDVEAGHRRGAIPDREVLAVADRIERTGSIAAWLGSVDAVHVISSLAGFEALLRGVAVTAHGVPFYAGWGLTRDLGPVPARRTDSMGRGQRSLDQLVAATLICAPRYLDPVTRLPCPVEVLVERLAAGQAVVSSPLVRLRDWQGRARLMVRRLLGRGVNRRG